MVHRVMIVDGLNDLAISGRGGSSPTEPARSLTGPQASPPPVFGRVARWPVGSWASSRLVNRGGLPFRLIASPVRR
jgi:hypothetical protein